MVYVGEQQNRIAQADGALCDIAPTLLELMALPQPEQMTGRSLLQARNTD